MRKRTTRITIMRLIASISQENVFRRLTALRLCPDGITGEMAFAFGPAAVAGCV